MNNKIFFQSCRIRMFRSKAALIILLWVFAASLNITIASTLRIITDYSFLCIGGTTALCGPIALLSDVYFGRYKVIHNNMVLVWIVAIASNGMIITKYFISNSDAVTQILTIIVISGTAGSAGILVNSLQFGIDQLTDASSSEISSFISWYVWQTLIASCVGGLITEYSNYKIVYLFFVLPLSCTLSILLDYFLSHWFVKEPVTGNPLKLIHQVLLYAVKNQYPRLRSAFTYWEDKPFSRIDLGKTKYGGPFSTEQVEDVKTFFRILAVLGLHAPMFILLNQLRYVSLVQYDYHHSLAYISALLPNLDIYTAVLIIPVIELLLNPILSNCSFFTNFSTMSKYLLGILLFLLYEINLLGIELAHMRESDTYNSTCFFYGTQETVNLYLLIAPKVLYGIAMYVVLTSCLEFIAAQAPYSMRGLLFGIGIFFYVLLAALPSLLKLARIKKGGGSHCALWFYVCMIFLTVFFFCAGLITKRCYSYRRRDENLHNEQIFAEDFYEKYLTPASPKQDINEPSSFKYYS